MPNEDPTPEIYAIMDRAGLNGATVYSSKKPMATIMNHIRTQIAADLKTYIEERERKINQTKYIEITEQ